jgi:hypothetical protein
VLCWTGARCPSEDNLVCEGISTTDVTKVRIMFSCRQKCCKASAEPKKPSSQLLERG